MSSIEVLRDGVKSILATKYLKALIACKEYKEDHQILKDDDKKIALEFEKAIYNQAVKNWKAGGRKDQFKAEYTRLFSAGEKALFHSPGLFPDRSVARELHHKELAPADAVCADILFDHENKDPRTVHRKMLVGSLLRDPYLPKDSESRQRALDLGTQIEASCYNHIITISKKSENPYRRQWASEAFTALYAARCAAVNSHLDPEGSVRQNYGDSFVHDLIDGKISPSSVGSMTESQMCPDASRKEREEIDLRNRQQVVVKESNLFQCPHCKARRCTYYEKQNRSLDEPAKICCTCLACRQPFVGHH
jgi:DNA-directed RNA polymerase subunit M/transcription elongation factor TFIIS